MSCSFSSKSGCSQTYVLICFIYVRFYSQSVRHPFVSALCYCGFYLSFSVCVSIQLLCQKPKHFCLIFVDLCLFSLLVNCNNSLFNCLTSAVLMVQLCDMVPEMLHSSLCCIYVISLYTTLFHQTVVHINKQTNKQHWHPYNGFTELNETRSWTHRDRHY